MSSRSHAQQPKAHARLSKLTHNSPSPRVASTGFFAPITIKPLLETAFPPQARYKSPAAGQTSKMMKDFRLPEQ